MSDASIEEMTSSPTGHIRPGIKIVHSRLCKLQELIISGADITDISLRHLSKLPELRILVLQGTFWSKNLYLVISFLYILNNWSKILACVQITSQGVSVFASDECLAPLNDKLSLRDCCSLKDDIVKVIKDLILEKNTATIVLSETRFITKGT